MGSLLPGCRRPFAITTIMNRSKIGAAIDSAKRLNWRVLAAGSDQAGIVIAHPPSPTSTWYHQFRIQDGDITLSVVHCQSCYGDSLITQKLQQFQQFS